MTTDATKISTDFTDQSIVVIGATGALGSATALRLSELGAKVTMTGANHEKLLELEEDITKHGGTSLSVNLRPDTEKDASEIIARAVEHFGRVDGLVVASGTNKVAMITDMTLEQFDDVMNANVRTTWLICRAFGAELLRTGSSGNVVIVTSTRALLGLGAGYTAYCASKGAENLLTRTLAAEWGAKNIRVNAVAPTVFRSNLTAWMYEDDERAVKTREGMLSRIPLGRLAEPEDVVGPTLFFLSAASGFCTGQILYVDGGYTAC
ncbi:MAG TPA: SDR family oxidoreductase [Acidimicrobiales bacterium]|nr:SDR family oxidoreductase [Acidimicrobiales bacterium]